ncbi:MAG: cation:proton antiporter [Candidatus Promineifilaceae bacterium]
MEFLHLPLEEPVPIFTLVLLIILLVPLVLKRIRVPGLIGLVIAGMIIGPYGLAILERDASIILFGTVGLLYLMFQAGLEIDLTDFMKNRHRSLLFGLLSALIPVVSGTLLGRYILHFSWAASILLSSMLASHTLLAYPIVSRMGISRNQVVAITIGGTLIADTIALIILAIIAGSQNGPLDTLFWLRLLIAIPVLAVVVVGIFPRIGAWFFRNEQSDGSAQYIFVLLVVFAAAFLAEIVGLEPILGAFLAGLALNRLIPHTSPLMNRIEFVGNALFIPFFLINVGMLVDLQVLLQGGNVLIVAGAMIFLAVVSKWLAAFIVQQLFRYSVTERNLVFGLSAARAAATLAIALVGFDLALFDEDVLNGAVLMILITSLISTFVVENAARKLAITEKEHRPDLTDIPERILVPISNPATIEQLIDLAVMVKNPQSPEPLYPLVVVKDDETARERVLSSRKTLTTALKHAAASDTNIEIVSRVDLNVANGIRRAIQEKVITCVILGWNGEVTPSRRIFGTVLDNLLDSTSQMILVSKLTHPLNLTRKIVALLPAYAECEPGFGHWLGALVRLVRQTGAPLHFYGTPDSLNALKNLAPTPFSSIKVSYHEFTDWDDLLIMGREITRDDLLLIISAREDTLSHMHQLNDIPSKLAKHFAPYSFVILYPEQNAME